MASKPAMHLLKVERFLKTGTIHADEDAESSEEVQTQEGEADAAVDSDGAEQKGDDRPMSWGRATGLAKLPGAMEWLRCCAHTPAPKHKGTLLGSTFCLDLLPGTRTRLLQVAAMQEAEKHAWVLLRRLRHDSKT